jgi:hypothetical protein
VSDCDSPLITLQSGTLTPVRRLLSSHWVVTWVHDVSNGKGCVVAKRKDPEDVVASIQRSIEVSPKGSRKVRCHSLRELFGFQAWTAERKELVTALLESRGVRP